MILVLAGIGVWALFPTMFTVFSNRAVVNARLATAVAPIGGVVRLIDDVRVGWKSPEGGAVARIVDPTVEKASSRIQAELKAWKSQLVTLRERRQDLIELRATFDAAAESYQQAYIERLQGLIKETSHEIEGVAVLVQQYEREAERVRKLYQSGNAAQAKLDEVEARLRNAVERRNALETRVGRYDLELAAAARGIYLVDSFNNTPYSEQRADEVTLRLIDLDGRVAELERQISQTEAALDAEIAREVQLGFAEVRSPVTGYVWELFVSNGEHLDRSQTVLNLVDCSRTFVDVTLPQSRIEDVHVGQPATVQVVNVGRVLEGEVTAVRSAAALAENLALSNLQIGRKFDDLQVIVRVPDPELSAVDHRFCDVGQRAIVSFEGEAGPFGILVRGLAGLFGNGAGGR